MSKSLGVVVGWGTGLFVSLFLSAQQSCMCKHGRRLVYNCIVVVSISKDLTSSYSTVKMIGLSRIQNLKFMNYYKKNNITN